MGPRVQAEGLVIDSRGHLCCYNKREGAMDTWRCCVYKNDGEIICWERGPEMSENFERELWGVREQGDGRNM